MKFTDNDLHLLAHYAAQFGLGESTDLGASARLVAHVEGNRDCKHDDDPGHQIMSHVRSALRGIPLGHEVATESVRRRAIESKP